MLMLHNLCTLYHRKIIFSETLKRNDINRRVERNTGGGRERQTEEKPVLAERLSHMKSSMLWPYASPGGLGIQATVSKQWGHLWLNPEDFSNRGVRENNAAIICQQVGSPGLAELNSPCGNSTGSSFRLLLAQERRSHKVPGRNTGMFVSFWAFFPPPSNGRVSAHSKYWPGALHKWENTEHLT